MAQNEINSEKLNILVIDDHPLILRGTIDLIQNQYPEANLMSAQSAQEGLNQVSQTNLDAIIVDLSICEKVGMSAEVEIGIFLLKQIMSEYPALNIMVQSSSINALVRVKHDIDNHEGGFTMVDKSMSSAEMLKMLDWCLNGITYTKKLKKNLEVKPEWLDVLHFAFKEGLQDKAIAAKMYKSQRMIRNYWSKIQDALEIYPEDNQNIRALTLIRAREEGLID